MYTGGEFDGSGVFSRIMSTLLVLLSYSSGMPVLYIIGAIFFLFTYFVNKLVLFKYYQRTLDLNRVVPQYSTQFFNLALLFHIVVGGFMITNPSLFSTHSDNGIGFKVPSLPLNPGDELKKSVGVLDAEESEFNELKDDPVVKIVSKVGERVQFFHQ